MAHGIVVETLTKTYTSALRVAPVRALDGVSLTIAPGEVFGIIGPNGAGKTTLFGCLLGFLKPDSGRVTIDGHAPDDLAVRAMTGYLPERLVLDRWMTGLDFLGYHHALALLPAATRRADCLAALERVGLEPAAGTRTIRSYSRGMLQRVGLAQALLGHPRYLFLDEPASGVDPAGVVLFRRLLGDLKGSGATVLLNSHQLDQVERVCDRVAFVKGGRVEAIETLSAGATLARVVRVRWAGGSEVADGSLAAAATQAGATLMSRNNTEARFSVSDDAASARLMASLVAAGVPVSEVAPEESRLERLFLDAAATGNAGAGNAGAAATSSSATPAGSAPASTYGPPGGAS
ncbi:MAG TPA: ABC transporter ATP-binding protein [Dongiaceae bacterium]|nr:ABC transporter ATP-binding protein [Dongiaceae bacterium]